MSEQPIQLPLATQCAGAMPSSDLVGEGSEPTIQIQLNTLGGQILQRRDKRVDCR